jgi:signal transduction histidine kinase
MTARRARRLLERGDLDEEATEQFADICDQMDDILSDAVETTRTLSTELSPAALADEDLSALLRWLAEHMQARYDLAVELHAEGAPPVESRERRAVLLRLVRELLFNVVKHAETDRARLDARVEDEGGLVVQVSDEGRGFDPEALANGEGSDGSGLAHMRERLRLMEGRMEVNTAPGEGTRVTVTFPDDFGE